MTRCYPAKLTQKVLQVTACKMTSILRSLLLLLALAIAGADKSRDAPFEKYEKDFLTEPQQRTPFHRSDFVFKFTKPDSETPNGNLRPRTVAQNPVLGTLPGNGVAQNLVTIEPCGQNQPHVHPRGTEISFITKGELFFAFIEENNGRVIKANMTKGQSIVIPQGLIHMAQNLGCKEAQFLASFPHRDPGTQTIASNFFRLPLFALRANLGTDDETTRKVAATALANKNPSADPECLKRCGIKS